MSTLKTKLFLWVLQKIENQLTNELLVAGIHNKVIWETIDEVRGVRDYIDGWKVFDIKKASERKDEQRAESQPAQR